MELYRAEEISDLKMNKDSSVQLESLRQPVIPPYLMLMPFIELPEGVVMETQINLEEDGVHGCIFQLAARSACRGKIRIGFRDMQSGETTHQKDINIEVV